MKIFSLLFFLLPSLVFAQAQVFPTRLTLTEETPSSYLNLRNTSGKSQKFEIDIVQFKLDKNGQMSRAKEVDAALIDLLKFSPKNIQVAANEKQVVRVMNTSFDTLKDGEYLVHLHFIPATDPNAPKLQTAKGSLNLNARIAVAVPVVIRKGVAKLDGKMSKVAATINKENAITVSFELSNSTSYFLTGDLEITAVTEKEEKSIAKIVGLSSYIPERAFKNTYSAKEIAEEGVKSEEIKKIKVRYASNNDSGAPFELKGETTVEKATAAAAPTKASKKSSKRP